MRATGRLRGRRRQPREGQPATGLRSINDAFLLLIGWLRQYTRFLPLNWKLILLPSAADDPPSPADPSSSNIIGST